MKDGLIIPVVDQFCITKEGPTSPFRTWPFDQVRVRYDLYQYCLYHMYSIAYNQACVSHSE